MSLSARVIRWPATAFCASLLLACGGGGGSDAGSPSAAPVPAPAPAPAPVTVSILGCEADARVRLAAGSGELLNNAWNAAAVGSFPWSQCVVEQRQGSNVQVGWTWRWPDTGDQVYSYPSIVVGAKPWFGGPGNDPRFPRRIADTPRLLLGYEVESSFTGNANLAASIWFTRTTATPSPAVESEISAEIMVWSDYTPVLVTASPALTERGRTQGVAGRNWRVFAAESWGDASGVSQHRWRFIVYVAEQTTRSLDLDLRQFIDDAISRGLIDPTHAIANVELGNEISSGSGNSWVRRFSLTTP